MNGGLPERWWRAGLALALLLAAAVRFYPYHRPYLHPEQEIIPRNAVVAVVHGDWKPFFLFHGSAVVYALRVLYTLRYALGRLTGSFTERLDLLAAFVRDPFPFFLIGRLFVGACSLATVYLVARLAAALGGRVAGLAAALLLAVTFIHVRESHHVWYDVPAAMLAVGAVLAALRVLATGERRVLGLAAALGGAALASKHSVFPVVLPVGLAAWWAGRGRRGRAGDVALAAAAGLGTYVALSPYSLLELRTFYQSAVFTARAVAAEDTGALPLGTLLGVGIGRLIVLLAAAGLVVSFRSDRRAAAVAAAFPLAYLVVLATGSRLHARYLAPLAPFAAVFAGVTAAAAGRPLGPGRGLAVSAMILVGAAVAPAIQSLRYDLVLAREDTRQLAGAWVREHIPPGTAITLPSANGYPNPILPTPGPLLGMVYGPQGIALVQRGFGGPGQAYAEHYLTGLFGNVAPDWQPQDRFIVTGTHPVVVKSARVPPAYFERLRAAGAVPVAEFRGFREPLPDGVVYDPIDADYVPLAGFDSILRPGPNITVWELPPRRQP